LPLRSCVLSYWALPERMRNRNKEEKKPIIHKKYT
jgi:hypothetical protein